MAILTGNTVDEWNENKEQRLMNPTNKEVDVIIFWNMLGFAGNIRQLIFHRMNPRPLLSITGCAACPLKFTKRL